MTAPNPSIPPLCRTCKSNPATRYLPGRKRSWYCDLHGPSKLDDWHRLTPAPWAGDLPRMDEARVLATAPPLPVRFAAMVDRFVTGLRDLLAEVEASHAAPPVGPEPADEHFARLKEENARLRRDLEAAESVAREALELVGGSETAAVEIRHRPTAPEPEPSSEPVEIGPRKADPSYTPPKAKPGPGYKITARPESAPATPPSPAVEEATVPPEVIEPSDADFDLFALDVLARRIPARFRSPGLIIAQRCLDDYDGLSRDHRRAVWRTLVDLALHPEKLHEDRLHAVQHLFDDAVVSLRATRSLRIVCTKHKGTYKMLRIVQRGNKYFYPREGY